MKIDCVSEPRIFSRWYVVGTTDFLQRPTGYYFYDKEETVCFGPFESSAEAVCGFDRYCGLVE